MKKDKIRKHAPHYFQSLKKRNRNRTPRFDRKR